MVIKSFFKHCLWPTLGIGVVFALRFLLEAFNLSETQTTLIKNTLYLLLIGLFCWLLIKGTDVLREAVCKKYDISAKDNLKARKIHTQLDVMRDIVMVLVIIIGLAMAVMVFDKGKDLGKTILASAGIIGIVVGVAAQKTIATFIAGMQIAFTQPIRLDDVVIVENEWGRIEDITLTYVVVKIWDQRRLIVPITYFIDKPFQNWTRTTAELLGTVFIYTDYTVPIDKIRAALQEIVSQSEAWDKRLCLLQVTHATDRTIELRALVSAADASLAWDLRCEVREKLIGVLQRGYPEALPKIRAELEPQNHAD